MKLLTMPLEIVARANSTTDEYGNEVAVDGTVRAVFGYLEQTDATEIVVGRETYVQTARCFLPAGTAVGADDAVRYAGVQYEVIGPPAPWFNPRTQRVHHVECRLRTSTG